MNGNIGCSAGNRTEGLTGNSRRILPYPALSGAGGRVWYIIQRFYAFGRTGVRNMILGIFLMSVSLLSVAAEPAAGSPGEVVAKLDAALVEAMKNAKALGYQGRYDQLAPVVLATHDFESISKLAVGKHWKTLDEGQKATLVKKLTEFSIANYAAQFDSYSGEEFVYQSEQPAKNERVTVLYVLKAKDEPEHKFAYTLQQVNGEWRIVNTVVDGFSNLASMKAQYENVIESEGFDSLISKLSEKIANYAKSRAGKNS